MSGATFAYSEPMITHSPELDKLAPALAKAQASVKGAAKDSMNPHFKSKYADLASVWDACRKPLTDNGLSVVQLPGWLDGRTTLTTMLLHVSGQYIIGTAESPIGKQDPQGVGSAVTYLRRYALAAVASVAPEDDDGEGAVSERGKAENVRPANPDGEITLPGDASKWDGWGGSPLSKVPLEVLSKARKWLAEKDAKKNQLLIQAMDEEAERRRDAA